VLQFFVAWLSQPTIKVAGVMEITTAQKVDAALSGP